MTFSGGDLHAPDAVVPAELGENGGTIYKGGRSCGKTQWERKKENERLEKR